MISINILNNYLKLYYYYSFVYSYLPFGSLVNNFQKLPSLFYELTPASLELLLSKLLLHELILLLLFCNFSSNIILFLYRIST